MERVGACEGKRTLVGVHAWLASMQTSVVSVWPERQESPCSTPCWSPSVSNFDPQPRLHANHPNIHSMNQVFACHQSVPHDSHLRRVTGWNQDSFVTSSLRPLDYLWLDVTCEASIQRTSSTITTCTLCPSNPP